MTATKGDARTHRPPAPPALRPARRRRRGGAGRGVREGRRAGEDERADGVGAVRPGAAAVERVRVRGLKGGTMAQTSKGVVFDANLCTLNRNAWTAEQICAVSGALGRVESRRQEDPRAPRGSDGGSAGLPGAGTDGGRGGVGATALRGRSRGADVTMSFAYRTVAFRHARAGLGGRSRDLAL